MVSPYYPNQVPWTDKKDWVSPENPGDLVEADHVNQLYAEVNAIGQDFVTRIPYATATGSANAYTITLQPAPASYKEGMAVAVKIHATNTGASTININGLGAKGIRKANGNNVSAGNLKAGSIYSMRYNGANFILQGSDSSGNAIPGDVLAGKTFSNDEDTDLTGTMPNRGAVVITPGTSNQTIAAGYHNGSGYVKGDADLVPENIKEGVIIHNVIGTFLPRVLIPSTTIQLSADSTRISDGTDWIKVKEVQINGWGTINIYFEYRYESGSGPVTWEVQKNGTRIYGATNIHISNKWHVFSHDCDVESGDVFSLWIRRAVWEEDETLVRYFRLRYDFAPIVGYSPPQVLKN